MPRPSKSALFAAATAWDTEAVKAVLAAAPSLITATDPRGRMALHMARATKPGPDGAAADQAGRPAASAPIGSP